MLKNSCVEAPLTFQQLDELVNLWSAQLGAEEQQFRLQAEYTNDLFFKIVQVHRYLEPIQNRMNFLNSLQDDLDRQIQCIKYNLNNAEQMLGGLELYVPSTCKCNKINLLTPESTYKLAENLACELQNIQTQVDQVQSHIPSRTDYSDIEMIADILQTDMKNLETIELRTEKIEAKMNEVEYYKQLPCDRNVKDVELICARLRRVDQLCRLPNSVLQQLALCGYYEDLENEVTLFRQGDTGKCWYAVMSGSLEVRVTQPETDVKDFLKLE
ncbi:hypothetical protein HUJ04_001729 [Dendroctonus ponderosae]|nr:hypothetical protein HUJ04_001729 [Dendroctonus ponderosae]